MPSRKIQDCVPALQEAWSSAYAEFISLYPELPKPFLTCTHRTVEEQAELYAQGRTKKGKIVTQLKMGSKHNYFPSHAFDIGFIRKDRALDWSAQNFKLFAGILKKNSPEVKWGGNWKKFQDLPHFEIHIDLPTS
jgi:peptidoglycan L-alanyl-D-glutamate endopeptidase CwlK